MKLPMRMVLMKIKTKIMFRFEQRVRNQRDNIEKPAVRDILITIGKDPIMEPLFLD
jgi:hypothetical protein